MVICPGVQIVPAQVSICLRDSKDKVPEQQLWVPVNWRLYIVFPLLVPSLLNRS